MKQKLREWWARLWGTFKSRDAEIEEELRFHLDTAEQDALRRGDSRREACLRAGGFAQASESVRDQTVIRWLRDFVRDTRHGARLLSKSPLFAAAAIASLALGIGANTAIFSVVNGVLISPLPFRNADRIVSVFEDMPDFAKGSISYPVFLDWQRDNRSFESMGAYRWANGTITGAGQPENVYARCVSAAFFPILGVNPILGRNFNAEDDRRGAEPTVLISEGLWQRKFGRDAGVIGKRLVVGGTGRTIVGVIPASFQLKMWNFRTADLYVPIGEEHDERFFKRDAHWGTGRQICEREALKAMVEGEISAMQQLRGHGFSDCLRRRRVAGRGGGECVRQGGRAAGARQGGQCASGRAGRIPRYD